MVKAPAVEDTTAHCFLIFHSRCALIVEFGIGTIRLQAFDGPETGQRLLYDFLLKMPQLPDAFSDDQLRGIKGHYPEYFTEACRRNLNHIE